MKSATKRGNQIVVGSITLLVALTAVLAYLNAGDLALKKELEMNAEFLFTAGETSERVSMSQILELQPVEFEAVMDTSITDPTPVTFTGGGTEQDLPALRHRAFTRFSRASIGP